jgi:FkbM family methyltransferase
LIKETAYKVLEAATRGKGVARNIGGETVRFPARWSRYYEADYEPETISFFHEHLKPGDTVLDIGGHIGLFAIVAAQLVGDAGKVFTFEPTPFTRTVLEEVVKINDCREIIEVRGEAVSSDDGTAVFFDTGDTLSNANSLVRGDRRQHEIPVTMVSIDTFVNERGLEIDCIKIDVEGAELNVLRGAHETFERFRPPTRLGLHPQQLSQNHQCLRDVWTEIQSLRAHAVFDGNRVDEEWFCSQAQLFDVNLVPA